MPPIDYNQITGPQRKVLREVLMGAFRNARKLDQFLDENGYAPLDHLVARGSFADDVFELIAEFRSTGKLHGFVLLVKREFPDAAALTELDARVALAGPTVETQRVARDLSANGFGLERMVRDGGFADLNLWAGNLLSLGRRVCRISYPVDHGVLRGSGFLVCSDLVLTNYHVIEPLLKKPERAPDVNLSFEYAETPDGVSPGERFRLHDAWHVASSSYSSADLSPNGGIPAATELDFALLRLSKAAGNAVSGGIKRDWVELGLAADVDAGDIVYVLQHPEGKPLKLSVGVVQPGVSPLRLRYDADTEAGSSGGLVVNQRLQPVALHHAGDPLSAVKATYNQGIPLGVVRAALIGDPAVPKFWN